MASILDTYKGSEFAKLGKSNKDKTPISADETNKLHFTDSKLDTARGGQVVKSKDKTPISIDNNNKLHFTDTKLNTARGGKVLLKPYSGTVNKK
jgi:hypothetical protein